MANKLTPVVVVSRDAAVTGVASINGVQGDVTLEEAGIAASGVNNDITDLTALSGTLTLGAEGVDDMDAVVVKQLDGLLTNPTIEGNLVVEGYINSTNTLTVENGNIVARSKTSPTPASGGTVYSGSLVSFADLTTGSASELTLQSTKVIGTPGVGARLLLSDKIDTSETQWTFPATGTTYAVMGAGQYGWGGPAGKSGPDVTTTTSSYDWFVNKHKNESGYYQGGSPCSDVAITGGGWADYIWMSHGSNGYGVCLQITGDGRVGVMAANASNTTGWNNKTILATNTSVEEVKLAAERKAAKLEELINLQAARIEAMEVEALMLKERLVYLEQMHDIVV